MAKAEAAEKAAAEKAAEHEAAPPEEVQVESATKPAKGQPARKKAARKKPQPRKPPTLLLRPERANGGGGPGARRRNAAVDFDWVRERLEEKRRELFGRYNRDLTAGLKASTGEGAEDLVDRANHAYSRELNFSLSDSDGILLNRIVEATARLDDGTFGICVHCSNELGRARLEAVPWAPYCVDCQELEEKGRLPADE